jgi:ABC-type nitrate/sulfonate/bicarbonate transport system permease component
MMEHAILEPTFAGLRSIPSLAWMFLVAAELIAATKG